MGSTSAANPAAMYNVFVYGSLLADDVVRVLLGRVPSSSPATLHDYHRFSIKGRVYPAVIPLETKKVSGKVLLGITPPELHILDMFEDEEYERTAIDVFLKDNSEKLQAHTYVWANKADPTLYGDWDFEEWKLLHMESFLNMTKGFMEEMEISDSKTRVPMDTEVRAFRKDLDCWRACLLVSIFCILTICKGILRKCVRGWLRRSHP